MICNDVITSFVDDPELGVDGNLDRTSVVRRHLCVEEEWSVLVIPKFDDCLEIGNS